MVRSEKESNFTIAPLVGAAGAAAAISAAMERYGDTGQAVALGTAAVALVLSQVASGPARAFLEGATIASIGIAILELVRSFRLHATNAVLVRS